MIERVFRGASSSYRWRLHCLQWDLTSVMEVSFLRHYKYKTTTDLLWYPIFLKNICKCCCEDGTRVGLCPLSKFIYVSIRNFTSGTSTMSNTIAIDTPSCSRCTEMATKALWLGDVQASVAKFKCPLYSWWVCVIFSDLIILIPFLPAASSQYTGAFVQRPTWRHVRWLMVRVYSIQADRSSSRIGRPGP